MFTEHDVVRAAEAWRGYMAKPAEPPHLLPTADEIQAAYVLAQQYTIEHPADDAEPVTEDWLRSVGWSLKSVFREMYHEPTMLRWAMPVLQADMGVWSIGEMREQLRYAPKTRGDVRRLCAALGVELKG